VLTAPVAPQRRPRGFVSGDRRFGPWADRLLNTPRSLSHLAVHPTDLRDRSIQPDRSFADRLAPFAAAFCERLTVHAPSGAVLIAGVGSRVPPGPRASPAAGIGSAIQLRAGDGRRGWAFAQGGRVCSDVWRPGLPAGPCHWSTMQTLFNAITKLDKFGPVSQLTLLLDPGRAQP